MEQTQDPPQPAISRTNEVVREEPSRAMLSADADGVAKGSKWYLLVSHSFTKFGSKAWEFATPIILLYLTFPSLFAPATYGISIFAFKFLLGPYAGSVLWSLTIL